ncbi:MAG: hypothetical protein CMM15_05100 [Rhodospirillaceae bacterium]|nr:hypothetical protein [Rhodospirillaceae bacterium]
MSQQQVLADKLADCLYDGKSIRQMQTMIEKSKKEDKDNLSQGSIGVSTPSYTPLMVAINFERDDLVKILLDQGAPPNDLALHYRYNYAISALDLALQNLEKKKSPENHHIVNLLIEHGGQKSDKLLPKGKTITIFGTENVPSKLQYQQQRSHW